MRRDLTELRAGIEWQECLRQSLYAVSKSLAPLKLEQSALDLLTAQAPPKLAWQTFDASAAISRIYALLEKAVCSLVEEYVDQIGRFTPTYAELNESLRVNHRVGVGQILSKWASAKSLYSHISEDAIAAGLADGLRGKKYGLLSDAFLTDSENYRPEVISRIFKKLGVEGAFDRSVKIVDATAVCSRITSAGDTPASYLNRLVVERNEAAHGDMTNLSSVRQLIEYADFVEILVVCLATLLRTEMFVAARAAGMVYEVARIVRTFSSNAHGSRASIATNLRPGQVYMGGRGLMHEVLIEELRFGKDQQEAITTNIGTEFGVRLNRSLAEGSIIFAWK